MENNFPALFKEELEKQGYSVVSDLNDFNERYLKPKYLSYHPEPVNVPTQFPCMVRKEDSYESINDKDYVVLSVIYPPTN